MTPVSLVMSIAFATRPNVLFIPNDDLRPMINRWPEPQTLKYKYMMTPNLDKFMDDAILLTNSHVQQAVCSPSRTSVLYGRRPDTTHVYNLYDNTREVGCADCITIPGIFTAAGYVTVGMGKIFHDGHASYYDDPNSWTDFNGTTTGKDGWFLGQDDGPGQCQPKADFWPWHEGDISELQASEQGSGLSWRSVNESVVGLCQDSQVREHGLMWMRRLAAAQRSALVNGETPQPFFLAVGLRKPHLPFVAPSSFFDLYPAADTQLAPNPYAPWDMPAVAYASEELQSYSDVAALGFTGAINETLPDWKALELVRAYQAALSFTDSNMGALLNELKVLGLWNSTIERCVLMTTDDQ